MKNKISTAKKFLQIRAQADRDGLASLRQSWRSKAKDATNIQGWVHHYPWKVVGVSLIFGFIAATKIFTTATATTTATTAKPALIKKTRRLSHLFWKGLGFLEEIAGVYLLSEFKRQINNPPTRNLR